MARIITHTQVSLDGKATKIKFDLELYYKLAAELGADSVLVGSGTARSGIEDFLEELPAETEADLQAPHPSERPYGVPWGIIDSRGTLEGRLHVYRALEYCSDIMIFISRETPREYIDYLESRNYKYRTAGDSKVNLKEVPAIMEQEFGSKVIRCDCGPTLNSLLMENGLADEVSMLISPVIAGAAGETAFAAMRNGPVGLSDVKTQIAGDGFVYIRACVKKI